LRHQNLGDYINGSNFTILDSQRSGLGDRNLGDQILEDPILRDGL